MFQGSVVEVQEIRVIVMTLFLMENIAVEEEEEYNTDLDEME